MNNRIRQIIEAQRLKQKDAAARLGVHASTLNSWLNGVNEPSKGARGNICATFGVRREWLETGDGEMFEKRAKTLADATIEELQEAYIDALLNTLPPEVQARVVSFVERYVEKKKQKEAEEKKRAERERREAERERREAERNAERAAKKRAKEEEEKAKERERRRQWQEYDRRLKEKRAKEFEEARANGTLKVYKLKSYENGSGNNVENVSET